MFTGDNGIIIVDTTESGASMKSIMVEFRKITTKPIVAIIFSHFHIGKLCILHEHEGQKYTGLLSF